MALVFEPARSSRSAPPSAPGAAAFAREDGPAVDDAPTIEVPALATPVYRVAVERQASGCDVSVRAGITSEVAMPSLPRASVEGGAPKRNAAFGPGALAAELLEVEREREVMACAFACWARGFSVAGLLLVDGADVVGAGSAGLDPARARRFRGARILASRHWLLDEVVRRAEPYLGEGSAEVGSTWVTEKLGLSPSARIAAVPIQDARGRVNAVFLGNSARGPIELSELRLFRGAVRAAYRLVQARGALAKLAEAG